MVYSNRKHYSQSGEDCLLWTLFDGKTDGFFVDVGAFDGIHLSNSYSFAEAGWHGICVEANPEMCERCRSNRPDSACVACACVGTDEIETVEFFTEPLGLLSGIEPDVRDVASRYRHRGISFDGFARIEVPARTLNALLEEFLPAGVRIDFISIDVEGNELDVLRGLDLRRYKPRVLVVEANNSKQERALYRHLVDRLGYVHARNHKVNMFFTRTENDAMRLREARAQGWLEAMPHPRGRPYTDKPQLQRQHVSIAPVPRWRQWNLVKWVLGVG